MPERQGPEFEEPEELDKEAIIRGAEEYSSEIRELSVLLEVARRWAQSTGANEAHEAVYQAAEARGYAVLSADREIQGLLDAQRSEEWRGLAKEDIEALKSMIPDFLVDPPD